LPDPCLTPIALPAIFRENERFPNIRNLAVCWFITPNWVDKQTRIVLFKPPQTNLMAQWSRTKNQGNRPDSAEAGYHFHGLTELPGETSEIRPEIFGKLRFHRRIQWKRHITRKKPFSTFSVDDVPHDVTFPDWLFPNEIWIHI